MGLTPCITPPPCHTGSMFQPGPRPESPDEVPFAHDPIQIEARVPAARVPGRTPTPPNAPSDLRYLNPDTQPVPPSQNPREGEYTMLFFAKTTHSASRVPPAVPPVRPVASRDPPNPTLSTDLSRPPDSDTTCLGLPSRTAKRPGVVTWGSFWGRQSLWQSQTGQCLGYVRNGSSPGPNSDWMCGPAQSLLRPGEVASR